MQKNIILIGMPGSGKSTIGVQLAKSLGLHFTDTDLLIQSQQQRQLQDILDHDGYLALRKLEEQVLLGLHLQHDLVATGGSAVYSAAGMQHLAQQGLVIFLDVDLNILKQRIQNESTRGIARPAHQSFEEVYTERLPLYQHFAHITVHNNAMMDIEQLTERINSQFTTP